MIAIGSPFGLRNTVTAGIVSAIGRETGNYLPFIQTDVAINPGNSGGPLINMEGEVVGVNSQIYSRTGGYMGISFAIPIDEAMQVAQQLRDKGRVTRGRIGVGIGPIEREVAQALGLESNAGALVRSVDQGGPAADAGLEPGDIIVEYAGQPIEKVSDLPRLVGATVPGTEASIKVWRRGVLENLTVKVAELEPELSDASRGQRPARAPKPSTANRLGLGVAELPDETARALRVRAGVLVKAVDGPAEMAGIRPGDVILTINNRPVDSVSAFQSVLADLEKGEPAVVLVQRNETARYLPLVPR
ncbi:MAG: PDZ domain-containing protein [Burkholderiaceae bacterium]